MPSTYSVSKRSVFDSSTVMTPSLPTFSMTSAMRLPTSGSLAEMAATWAISVRPCTGWLIALSSATTASTPRSMPRLSCSGLAPAATLRKPSVTMAWARTVAVVVPSPATSLVLVAASLRSWAPMFSNGSSSSISLAMVTPSLVMVGAPNFLSSTTLRPRGPRVTLTVSANLFTPVSRRRRASSEKERILAAMRSLLLDDRQDVTRREDQQVLAVDGDLGAAVLGVDDRVALLDVGGDDLTGLVGPLARPDGEDGALLGLLLGRVGDD